MAGNTLTVASTLMCPHGGSVTIISTNPKSPSAGAPIVTVSDQFIVAGCPFTIPATPPIPSPCVTVRWIVSDLRVKTQTGATLSQSSQGLCMSAAQVPQGPVSIVATQPRVSTQ